MRNLAQTSAALTLVLASANVFAGPTAQKAQTNIEFNQMIDESNNARRDLQADVDQSMQNSKSKKDERGKVIDFIDVEIGVGQPPAVTDRRFDSVGDPVVVDLKQIKD